MDLPRFFGIEDYCRRYILPPECHTALRAHDSDGDYGVNEHARGILVELLFWLDATAVSLDCVCVDLASDETLVVITAAVVSPAFGPVRVETYRHGAIFDPSVEEWWAIYVNGQRLAAEDRRHPPSPCFTGMLVRRALRDGVVAPHAAATPSPAVAVA